MKREINHIFALFKKDRFKAKLYLSFNLCTGKISSREFQKEKSEEMVLLVLHSNYLNKLGGVEKETLEMLKKLVFAYSKRVGIYFYDETKKTYFLQEVTRSSCKTYRFESDCPTKNFLMLLKNWNIRFCILEHLFNHSLEYQKLLDEKKIIFVLFVHDFYYICPEPYYASKKGYNPINFICSQLVDYDLSELINSNQDNKSDFKPKDWDKKIIELFNSAQKVIYNSEFTKNKYENILNKLTQKRFRGLVSYPKFFSGDTE
jgi:hypothetical protein